MSIDLPGFDELKSLKEELRAAVVASEASVLAVDGLPIEYGDCCLENLNRLAAADAEVAREFLSSLLNVHRHASTWERAMQESEISTVTN